MKIDYLKKESGRRIPFVLRNVQTNPRAITVLIHGIFSEKHEDGRFIRLTEKLSKAGIVSVRFDYAGHGDHSFPSSDFSIANSLADIHYIMQMVKNRFSTLPIFVIASSFGGGLTLIYLRLSRALHPERLVLLNPVTDFVATILKPQEPQMQERFTDARMARVYEKGEADFGDGFRLTLPFILELELYQPFKTFPDLAMPTLVVHGDSDTAVPYEVTRKQALTSYNVQFETIHGADHAFVEPDHETESFNHILEFLS